MNRHMRVCRGAQRVEAQQQRLRDDNYSDEGLINDVAAEPETFKIQEAPQKAPQDGEPEVDFKLVTVRQEPTEIAIKKKKNI